MNSMKMQKLPTWRQMHMDTSPEIEAIQFKFYRETPVWRKFEIAAQLHEMSRTLALSGLRRRHPNATDTELRYYLAEKLLGPELARQVYGAAEEGETQQDE